MKTFFQIVGVLCGLFVCRAKAQIYDTNNVVVQTFAGSGFYGYLDGVGQQTMFYNPMALVSDSSGNLFVLDASNYRIRKITPDGTVSTFVGGGTSLLPGFGTNVNLAPYVGHPITIRSISSNPLIEPVLPANLQVSTYPGLQIIGTVGRTYQVQTSPDMNQWNTVATLLLTASPYLWIDQNPVNGNRFYRAFLLP